MKIICVANGSAMSYTPYMAKIANYLDCKGVDIGFWTWRRFSDIEDIQDPSSVKNEFVFDFGKASDSRFVKGSAYILWMLKLFAKSLFSTESLFLCSRFESAFPVWCASFFNRKLRFVYLDRDCPHMTYAFPGFVISLLKFLEIRVAKGALAHVVPGRSRDFTGSGNVFILPNMPSAHVLKAASRFSETVELPVAARGKVVVYINGWLVETRGRDMIIKAISDESLRENFYFIIAGEVDEALLSICKTANNVFLFGRLSPECSLSLYYKADLVLCFYDPAIKINQLAEPNKWWDCVATQTPFLTNRGIDTLEQFKGKVRFDCVDYAPDSLANWLKSDCVDRLLLLSPGACRFNNSEFEEVSWDLYFDSIYNHIIGSIDNDK